MTDIFREIDEDLRRDRYSKLLRRLAPAIVAVIVLIVAGVGGWQAWRWFNRQSAEQAGGRFEEALQTAREGRIDEAEQALAAVAADSPAGYRLLARFRLAAIEGGKDPAAGAAAFTAIADDSSVDTIWRDLARLRATLLRIGTLSADEVQAALQPLAAPGQPWRFTALEALGVVALDAGRFEEAGRWFDQIITDPAAPAGLRRRVQEFYLALVASGPSD
ncbi:tetratricopeptide repeat protein [Pseudochelatococcus sp. B33]